jgi:anti-sigma-K factor RskA
MTDELRFPDPLERRVPRDADALDERTARAIHEAYLPPVARGEAENAYWSALEQRIMSRVAGAEPVQRDPGYWSVLNGWAQVGLVAAAALFAVGGVVSQQLGEPEEQVAYESVVPASTPEAVSAPAALLTASNRSARRDAALQYILSY